MNNICKTKFLSAILLSVSTLALESFAYDIYWKGGYTTNGAGFYYESSWDAGYPTAEDDVVIDETYITTKGNGNLVDGFWNSDTTWNSLTLNYTNANNKINSNANGPVQITITTDLKKLGGGCAKFSMGSAGTVFNLSVGGNVIVGVDKDTSGGYLYLGADASNETTSWDGPLDLLTIGGDVILYNSSRLYFDVYNRNGTSTYRDPDVHIGKGLVLTGSGAPNYVNPQLVLFNIDPTRAPAQDTTSIISVESITGDAFLLGNSFTSEGTQRTDAVLYLRGETEGAHYTFEGWTSDIAYNGTNPSFGTTSKLKIVKDGPSTQIFSGTQLKFSGGVEVLGGTLAFNGNADGRDTSHGDLMMRGGKFSYMVRNENQDSLGKSYMTFENLVYSDGTISLQVAPDSVDKVLLTGTLVAADASNKGVVKIELVGEDLSYFESDYRLLIGMGTASSDYDDGDFMITNLDKSKYSANFDLRDDGLYLKLDVIPEPGAVAAIFGALALAYASRRRRK